MPLRLAPALQFKPDELYRVPTADGSAIALGRYHPRGPKRFHEPVLLVHSLGINRFNLDFDERYSVARALARRGFESWVLELRGHGLGGSAAGATFDTEVEHDVGAALATLRSTGAEGVLWVGHSRGGLLAYAHLARNPRAPVKAVVAIGSPLHFDAQPGLRRFLSALGPSLRLPVFPLELAARAWPLGLPPDPFGKYLLRADNVEPRIIRQALSHAMADIAGGVGRQFARWVQTGAFDGEDGFDYRRGLGEVTVPILSIAGARDHLVPPPSAHAIRDWSRGPVELLTAGLQGGLSTDYGHGDLVLGLRAPEEIVPRIADFFARHATPTA